jgi:hypothetical protein
MSYQLGQQAYGGRRRLISQLRVEGMVVSQAIAEYQ